MSQRVVPLGTPETASCGVRLTAPANANLAPPGYYMLFLLDADGTPSKARFVRLTADPQPASDCPAPPPGTEPSPEPTATATGTAAPTTEPTPEPTATPTNPVSMTVKVTKTSLRKLRRTRRLAVKVRTSRAASIRAGLLLRRKRLSRALTLTTRAGRPRKVRLKLSRAGRRRLRGVKRATLTVRVTAVPTLGDPATVTRRLRVRR